MEKRFPFWGLVRYDCICGFHSWRFQLPITVLCALAMGFTALGYFGDSPVRPGFEDLLAAAFLGNRIPEPGSPILPDAGWLAAHLLPLIFAAAYPRGDMDGLGKRAMLACGRGRWWMAKCLWLSASYLEFFAVLYLVLLLVAVFAGQGAVPFQSRLFTPIFGPGAAVPDPSLQLRAGLYLSPLLVTSALGLPGLWLSLATGPVPALVLQSAVLVVSVFFHSPLLIGNYSMFFRAGNFYGLIPLWLISCAVSVVGGLLYMGKKDLLRVEELQH